MGVAEAGFFPAAIFTLSCWYLRGELGRRVAYLYGSASLAGAFSGILAFGIAKMGAYLGVRSFMPGLTVSALWQTASLASAGTSISRCSPFLHLTFSMQMALVIHHRGHLHVCRRVLCALPPARLDRARQVALRR